jgi:hypothetical protein
LLAPPRIPPLVTVNKSEAEENPTVRFATFFVIVMEFTAAPPNGTVTFPVSPKVLAAVDAANELVIIGVFNPRTPLPASYVANAKSACPAKLSGP